MKLISILDRDCIYTQSPVTTKEEAIDLVLHQFAARYKVKQQTTEMKHAILEREKLGGTLLENGMAVPHARLEGFNDLFIGIVIPQNPVTDESGAVITSFIVFLTTKSGTSLYLKTLAAFARVGMNTALYSRFLSSPDRDAVIETLKDLYVEKELTVKDIMSPEVLSVKPGQTIKDLINLLYKHRISYVPVVNDGKELIGEVNINDLLKIGIPNYAVMIGKLDFLSHFEPFEELLNNEDKIPVSHIMRKADSTLLPGTTIIETALLMTKFNRRHLPVVENGKIVGVVSFMDLLSKVLRA
ncbi:MAG: CBS domain-containing protein [Spirochaetales bacterium]|nr:CBS domain-containing protein [Spirochaetales bacterium]